MLSHASSYDINSHIIYCCFTSGSFFLTWRPESIHLVHHNKCMQFPEIWPYMIFFWGMMLHQQIICQMFVSFLHRWEYYLIRCNVHGGNLWKSGWHKYGTPLCKLAAQEPQWLLINDSAAQHNPTRRRLGQSAQSSETDRPLRRPDETQSPAGVTISCSTRWGGSAHIPAAWFTDIYNVFISLTRHQRRWPDWVIIVGLLGGYEYSKSSEEIWHVFLHIRGTLCIRATENTVF